MGEPATAKVKIKTKPDLMQDDALRNLFVQSLKDYCKESEIELEKKDIEVVVKEIIEVSGQVVKNTVDAFVDCYMMNMESEDEGEEGENSDSESEDSE